MTVITIGDVVTWERLRCRRFDEFDGDNMEDVAALGYVLLHTREYTFTAYLEAARGSAAHILDSVSATASAEFKYISQFVKQADADTESGERESITEIAGTLIMGGVNGVFLLSRGIEDLQWLCAAYQKHTRQEMENRRFWSYVQLSPWIDRQRTHNAREFMPFAWDSGTDNVSEISDFERKLAKAFWGEK